MDPKRRFYPFRSNPGQIIYSDAQGRQIEETTKNGFSTVQSGGNQFDDCRVGCKPESVCPELRPSAKCQTRQVGMCQCTVYCKNTIKFLRQFVSEKEIVIDPSTVPPSLLEDSNEEHSHHSTRMQAANVDDVDMHFEPESAQPLMHDYKHQKWSSDTMQKKSIIRDIEELLNVSDQRTIFK